MLKNRIKNHPNFAKEIFETLKESNGGSESSSMEIETETIDHSKTPPNSPINKNDKEKEEDSDCETEEHPLKNNGDLKCSKEFNGMRRWSGDRNLFETIILAFYDEDSGITFFF